MSYKRNSSAKVTALATDESKLSSIITNLIKNAIKYTNSGTIEFGFDQSGDELIFYVTDTGIGIQEDRQNAIFDRFIQADISDINALQGAGLGLSISKAYVEILGGTIGVESEIKKGSKFYFTHPYKIGNGSVSSQNDSGLVKTEPKHATKILIAEDDENSYVLIKTITQDIFRDILHAKNGLEAIDICKKHPDIKLVFMDIKMPIMNGYQASKEIRKFHPKLTIIAQSRICTFS